MSHTDSRRSISSGTAANQYVPARALADSPPNCHRCVIHAQQHGTASSEFMIMFTYSIFIYLSVDVTGVFYKSHEARKGKNVIRKKNTKYHKDNEISRVFIIVEGAVSKPKKKNYKHPATLMFALVS